MALFSFNCQQFSLDYIFVSDVPNCIFVKLVLSVVAYNREREKNPYTFTFKTETLQPSM